MAIGVNDSHGNYNETLERHADVLGRSPERKSLFSAIYAGKKAIKTASELAITTGLSHKRVLTLGHELSRHDVVAQVRSPRADGKLETAYAKTDFAKANRDKIIALAAQPKSERTLPTKRQTIVIERPKAAGRATQMSPSRSTKMVKLKVLLAIAMPDNQGRIRPDKEVRHIKEHIQKSTLRDSINLEVSLAADAESLIHDLNTYRPDVVQFSGHGGGGAIVMDSAEVGGPDGAALSLEILGRILKATDRPPRVVILNACDTADEAAVLLGSSDVVIAMSDSVSDFAADIFGQKLWGALASGQPIGLAFDQAIISLEVANMSLEAATPTLIHREGLDVKKYRLLA